MKVWTTAVGVKRTSPDQRMPLTFELDAVASNNVFNWVRLLKSGGVDAPCGRCDARSLYCHSS